MSGRGAATDRACKRLAKRQRKPRADRMRHSGQGIDTQD